MNDDTAEITPLEPQPPGKADAAAIAALSPGLATDISIHDMVSLSELGRRIDAVREDLQPQLSALGAILHAVEDEQSAARARLTALEARLESMAAGQDTAGAMNLSTSVGASALTKLDRRREQHDRVGSAEQESERNITKLNTPFPRGAVINACIPTLVTTLTRLEVEPDSLTVAIPNESAELQEAAATIYASISPTVGSSHPSCSKEEWERAWGTHTPNGEYISRITSLEPDAGLKEVDLSNHMDPGEHRVSIFSAPSWPRESEGAFTQTEIERDCLGMSIPAKPAELQEAAPEHDVVAPRIAGGVVADHIGSDDLVRPDDTE